MLAVLNFLAAFLVISLPLTGPYIVGGIYYAVKGRTKQGFPVNVNNFWYMGSYYGGTNVLPKKEGKPYLNPFRCGIYKTDPNKDTSGLIDGLIPLIYRNDKVGLYKITKSPYYSGRSGDQACWDDGLYVDLKLVKVEDLEKVKQILAKQNKGE